jgi:predicted ATP-grasp superfamily ATP-dependent carboligase
MVLSQSNDQSKDRIIEINPRLTTSYVGLRAAVEQNLAAIMLELAAGRRPRVTYRPEAIAGGLEFDAGNVRLAAHALAGA